jgi:hypothetical protein
MLTTFNQTQVKKDDQGQYWILNQSEDVLCECFSSTEEETIEDMLGNGYALVPYQYENTDLFVLVD